MLIPICMRENCPTSEEYAEAMLTNTRVIDQTLFLYNVEHHSLILYNQEIVI